jgi:hypothetical protein
MTHKNTNDNVQPAPQQAPQEELLSYPFSFAEHSLECPAIYDRLRQECPVARVRMPFGGDAFLLTRHADVVKAFTDPQCGIIQAADGAVPAVNQGEWWEAEAKWPPCSVCPMHGITRRAVW